MQVTKELVNKVTGSNYAPSVDIPEKGQGLCVTRLLKCGAMLVNTAKSQPGETDDEKFNSSYEDIFSDVVTTCYVRGYN